MNLNSQNIALLGLGKENQAFLSWLFKHNYRGQITICDYRKQQQLEDILKNNKISPNNVKNIQWQIGAMFNKNLFNFEVLFRSPGWPIACPGIQAALKKGILLTSPMEYFLAACPTSKTIGVTGSKGKGTTASLITAILKKAGHKVWLGGNIGIAPFTFFDKIKKDDWVVLELSSFQLEDLSLSPRYAVITNLFKEHLAPADPYNPNYHKNFNDYWQAKLQIALNPNNSVLVINEKLKDKLEKEKINSKIVYFTKASLPTGLKGDYNQENIGAAVELSKILKIPAQAYNPTIKNFHNLEHRLEFVLEQKGIKYFDNSFSTTPESTILDLLSFTEPIIQIAGGADKGSSFKNLAQAIAKKVKILILLKGEATPRLLAEVKKTNFSNEKIFAADSMEEALKISKKYAISGDIVLLSTACASFGIFKNYKERGDQFKFYARQ
ncbi:MAG: UDP-N-acetylmuramoyl-L-alanine--D-glutamate ligase [Patescibacteria group bacterium]|nr:UDP-N-acetylmuramoyl-L-alanine--D-glutamate ligase [Patescibacteria group bacterium]